MRGLCSVYDPALSISVLTDVECDSSTTAEERTKLVGLLRKMTVREQRTIALKYKSSMTSKVFPRLIDDACIHVCKDIAWLLDIGVRTVVVPFPQGGVGEDSCRRDCIQKIQKPRLPPNGEESQRNFVENLGEGIRLSA